MSRNHFMRAIAASIICITMFGASTTAAQGTVTVSGTVIDGRPGQACVPVAGASVELADISDFFDLIDTVVSDNDGSYVFSGVPNKTLTVLVVADGFTETSVGRTITVTGNDLTGINPFLVGLDEEGNLLFDPCTGLNPPGTDPTPDPGTDPDPGPGGGGTDPGTDPGTATPGPTNAFMLTSATRACEDQTFKATWTGTNIDAIEFALSNTSDDWTSGWLPADAAAGSFTTAVDHHGYDKVVTRVTFADGTVEDVSADVGTCTTPSTPEKPTTPQKPGGVTSLPSTGSGNDAGMSSVLLGTMAIALTAMVSAGIRRAGKQA
ncbi:MAG: carboxypeptidase-like regulatory domain-containing protein [Thermomicrobiales bacterium]|nr:carboxypeptidase-like regulatory domain-containing protein [Thermomicrobiales bacterium]MCO5227456.1 carboxypeptidase-like regulatory domain-containing protein [Thermomicrobiales bacterium]